MLKIARHLREKGVETWMWGDHLVDTHNRFGKRWNEGGVVQYERPDTRTARDRLVASGVRLNVFNWSGEEGDLTFQKLGWPFLVGNFAGSEEKDWPARARRHGALGGEVSSWGAFEEFLLGKLQIPEAAYSSNMLWSSTALAPAAAMERVAALLPKVRGLLAATPPPSATADPMRFEVLDLARAFNSAPRGEGFDLSGLAPGRGYRDGLPYAIADPARGPSAVVVARRSGDPQSRALLPVSGRWASLLFLHAATAAGRASVHAGDQTHFPHESSELIGYYEIRYADDLVDVHEIRYDENVARWDAGLSRAYYFGRAVVSGKLPDGRGRRALGERVGEPQARRRSRLRHARGRARLLGGAPFALRSDRGREAARRGLPLTLRRARPDRGRGAPAPRCSGPGRAPAAGPCRGRRPAS